MISKLVLQNLLHRPLRTLLSMLAIGIEVTLMLTIVGLSRGTLGESAKRAQGIGADIWLKPSGSTPISFSPAVLPEKWIGYFAKQPHVRIATGSMLYPTEGIGFLTGIDLQEFTKLNGGFQFVAGGPFQQPGDVIVDEYYARQNKKKVGDTVRLIERNWRVSGICEPGKLARVMVDLKTLQTLTGSTGKLSQIFLKLDDPKNTQTMIADFKSRLKDFNVYSTEELISLFSVERTPGLSVFIDVIIGISMIVGFLVVALTMYTVVLERTREIGILKALGASPGFILGSLVLETVVLAVIGTVVGILLSYGSRWVILSFVPASVQQAIVPDWWWKAGLIALISALLGALYPGLRAAKQDTVEALSYE